MAANVYYSVSPFGTGDIKTGSPTITISSGVATLSVGQTGNIGRGDRITYNTSSACYISGVTDSTHFDVVTATGGAPSNVTGQTVNSIAHEYASLSAAEAGASDANHINNTSLVTADVVLNLCCYYDHDDHTIDTSQFNIDTGWTTSATQYVKLYTPNGGTQSINSQRSSTGKWDSNKFILNYNQVNPAIYSWIAYLDIDGLQIRSSRGGVYGIVILRNQPASSVSHIDNCIIDGESSSTTTHGIKVLNPSSGASHYIRNCTISNVTAGNGIQTDSGTPNVYIYNTTVHNCSVGIYRSVGSVSVINCAIFGNTDDFTGTMTVTYTASDDNDVSGTGNVDISPGATETTDWAKAFKDYANGDFSVKDTDSVLYDAGTDLSGTFTTDIIGTTRSSWDIGAFEYVAAVTLAFPPLFARHQNTLLRR